jgi:predicted nucleotidyltransferase
VIASPNNILGIEYLRALQTTSSQMHAFTISRLGADYHSTDVSGNIASATGIRKLIAEGDKIDHLLPTDNHQILEGALAEGRSLDHERLFMALQTFLLQEQELLEGLCQVNDGLEKRLVEAVMTAESYTDLVALIKSRHWTMTRIQRILSYVLLQLSGSEMANFLESGPLYLRLLGATEQGRKVLAKARKKRSLPLISDPARARATLRRFYQGQPTRGQLAERMLNCDLRATRIYSLLQKTQQNVHRNQDFFRPVQQV